MRRLGPPRRGEMLWMTRLLAVPPAALFLLKARHVIAGALDALLPYDRLDDPGH